MSGGTTEGAGAVRVPRDGAACADNIGIFSSCFPFAVLSCFRLLRHQVLVDLKGGSQRIPELLPSHVDEASGVAVLRCSLWLLRFLSWWGYSPTVSSEFASPYQTYLWSSWLAGSLPQERWFGKVFLSQVMLNLKGPYRSLNLVSSWCDTRCNALSSSEPACKISASSLGSQSAFGCCWRQVPLPTKCSIALCHRILLQWLPIKIMLLEFK